MRKRLAVEESATQSWTMTTAHPPEESAVNHEARMMDHRPVECDYRSQAVELLGWAYQASREEVQAKPTEGPDWLEEAEAANTWAPVLGLLGTS